MPCRPSLLHGPPTYGKPTTSCFQAYHVYQPTITSLQRHVISAWYMFPSLLHSVVTACYMFTAYHMSQPTIATTPCNHIIWHVNSLHYVVPVYHILSQSTTCCHSVPHVKLSQSTTCCPSLPHVVTAYHMLSQPTTCCHSLPHVITVYHMLSQHNTCCHSLPHVVTVYHMLYQSTPTLSCPGAYHH